MLQFEADQRDRLVNATDRINRSGEKVKESRRQLIETEDLGVRILQDLHVQHQTLLHTQQMVSLSSTLMYSKGFEYFWHEAPSTNWEILQIDEIVQEQSYKFYFARMI